MTLGLVVTMSALACYFVMTYSPMEGVSISRFWSGEIAVITSGSNPPTSSSGPSPDRCSRGSAIAGGPIVGG